MPLVHPCGRKGCGVLTMGEYCIEHEPPRREAVALRARVEVRTVSAVLPVWRPLYSPPGEHGEA